jgi:hypothetical protein
MAAAAEDDLLCLAVATQPKSLLLPPPGMTCVIQEEEPMKEHGAASKTELGWMVRGVVIVAAGAVDIVVVRYLIMQGSFAIPGEAAVAPLVVHLVKVFAAKSAGKETEETVGSLVLQQLAKSCSGRGCGLSPGIIDFFCCNGEQGPSSYIPFIRFVQFSELTGSLFTIANAAVVLPAAPALRGESGSSGIHPGSRLRPPLFCRFRNGGEGAPPAYPAAAGCCLKCGASDGTWAFPGEGTAVSPGSQLDVASVQPAGDSLLLLELICPSHSRTSIKESSDNTGSGGEGMVVILVICSTRKGIFSPEFVLPAPAALKLDAEPSVTTLSEALLAPTQKPLLFSAALTIFPSTTSMICDAADLLSPSLFFCVCCCCCCRGLQDLCPDVKLEGCGSQQTPCVKKTTIELAQGTWRSSLSQTRKSRNSTASNAATPGFIPLSFLIT